MRIVHLLAPAHAGGLERVVQSLAIGQQRRGHDVRVLPMAETWSDEHPFMIPLRRAGVDVRPIVLPRRAYLRERAALARALEDASADVAHTHGYHADVVGGPVARRMGCGIVSTAHGFTGGSWKNRLYEWLSKRALRRFDAVAAVSDSVADDLRRSGVPAERVHTIGNAWSPVYQPADRAEAREALGLAADGFVAGWVGRMSREKGLDVMIDALAALRHRPVRVCAIGDGPERGPEEARATRLGLNEHVTWAGMRQEAGRYFRAFDVMVISSRTEGLPMVLLEAFAAGVPVVTTSVGGIPTVASDTEALLVPPERPRALAAAVETVLREPEEAAVRARAAQERLEREFSEGPWLERYEEIYRIALDRRAASRE